MLTAEIYKNWELMDSNALGWKKILKSVNNLPEKYDILLKDQFFKHG